MLTLLFTLIGISLSLMLTSNKNIWTLTVSQLSFLLLGSLFLININVNSFYLSNDTTSTPLIILSFWLMPVSILASIGHLTNNSSQTQRTFAIFIIIILSALTLTFSTTNVIIFFIGFESTLVPTLFLISRWGMQQERIEAGYYFVFYTLASSLPLLLTLIFIYNNENHLSFPLFNSVPQSNSSITLIILCLIAFLVKVPIFGLHLWLPKAHVEAPVAGSMILAAILLKLGGYGFIRLTTIFINTFQENVSNILIPFCCWGGALTSIICITQTDLKSLIAYSSVSHMSFMIAGLSTLTSWSVSGGIIVMVAHGLVSSALFCIANVYYERTGTRNLSASRGIKSLFLVLPTLWLLFAAANLGLPPFPNSIGELFIFSGVISNSLTNVLPTIIGVVFTGIFSLIIYQQLNTGTLFTWNTLSTYLNEREYLTLNLHLLPLIVLILNPNIITL
uniref:NADH-ubiquinone oxidoreductase chain 4 n=1 Tax=Amphioplus laevis TaxID=2806440 RepID=A0A888V4T0_9ECHI|nr:NADH dehydrogenase subunit 4 [Amphioplus laevis]QRC36798.1 NADH dehydrogenase subunit 4 [Amphioplus laevis]